MTSLQFFHFLVACHIVTGASGAISFWVPVAARKGGAAHRKWGRFFAVAMIATGFIAASMAVTTLADPVGTHPHLPSVDGFEDPQAIRDIFGWMMLYLAVLTVNLAWHGWICAAPGRTAASVRAWPNLLLQAALTIAAANCAWRGFMDGQALMIGISMVGFATVATNCWFMAKARPSRPEWIREHIKAIVGTGISVYTAFFAFGAVRLVPELALNPVFWAVPLVTGVSMIVWFQRAVTRQAARPRMAPGE